MIFAGKKTVIAPLEKADLPLVWRFRDYEPTLGFFEDYHDFHAEGERLGIDPYVLFKNWALNQMYGTLNWHYAIYKKSPAELIGAIWTTEVTKDSVWPTILMDRSVWGQGYAEDAAETLIRIFLGPRPMDGKPEGGFFSLNVFVHKGNKRSLAFVRRLGFRETGYFPRGDDSLEQRIFTLTKEDWLNRPSQNEMPRPKKKRGRPKKLKEVTA